MIFFGNRDSFKGAGYSRIYLPKTGDQVHLGAWVTDKPKGWHELHPAWKDVNEAT
jgi:hypothetical protein